MSSAGQCANAVPRRCQKCNGSSPRLTCSLCHSAHYCNEKCQRAHWKVHKELCKVLKKAYDAAPNESGGGGSAKAEGAAKLAATAPASGDSKVSGFDEKRKKGEKEKEKERGGAEGEVGDAPKAKKRKKEKNGGDAAKAAAASHRSPPENLQAKLHCAHCGGRNPSMKCTLCNDAYYCDKKCSKNHWKVHKDVCGKKRVTGHVAGSSTDKKEGKNLGRAASDHENENDDDDDDDDDDREEEEESNSDSDSEADLDMPQLYSDTSSEEDSVASYSSSSEEHHENSGRAIKSKKGQAQSSGNAVGGKRQEQPDNQARCQKCQAKNPRLLCSACNTVHYCNAECQKAHWSEHKRLCKIFKKKKMSADAAPAAPAAAREDKDIRKVPAVTQKKQERRCQFCSKVNPTLECSLCHSVHYCDKECQRKHWDEHKKICSMLMKAHGNQGGSDVASSPDALAEAEKVKAREAEEKEAERRKKMEEEERLKKREKKRKEEEEKKKKKKNRVVDAEAQKRKEEARKKFIEEFDRKREEEQRVNRERKIEEDKKKSEELRKQEENRINIEKKKKELRIQKNLKQLEEKKQRVKPKICPEELAAAELLEMDKKKKAKKAKKAEEERKAKVKKEEEMRRKKEQEKLEEERVAEEKKRNAADEIKKKLKWTQSEGKGGKDVAERANQKLPSSSSSPTGRARQAPVVRSRRKEENDDAMEAQRRLEEVEARLMKVRALHEAWSSL